MMQSNEHGIFRLERKGKFDHLSIMVCGRTFKIYLTGSASVSLSQTERTGSIYTHSLNLQKINHFFHSQICISMFKLHVIFFSLLWSRMLQLFCFLHPSILSFITILWATWKYLIYFVIMNVASEWISLSYLPNDDLHFMNKVEQRILLKFYTIFTYVIFLWSCLFCYIKAIIWSFQVHVLCTGQ